MVSGPPYLWQGRYSEARSALEEAFAVVNAGQSNQSTPELHPLGGEILALEGAETGLVEAAYRRAMELGRGQGARAWELRAATSLARLWQRQGSRAEARDLLEPVYTWFTEGFGTLDLEDAKELLEELAQALIPQGPHSGPNAPYEKAPGTGTIPRVCLARHR